MTFSDQNHEEVSLEIDGTTFRFWSDIEVNLVFDGHSSVSFSAPFEPDLVEFREAFRPFAFKPVKVLVGGEVLFTGTMVDVAPQVDANSKTVSVTAYSRAAVLGDVTAPAGQHPLEFNGLNLLQISEKLLEPFGLAVSGPDVGSPFERVTLEVDGKIQDFLVELAKQRGLILASDADGDLLYRENATIATEPVARLNGSESPVLSVAPAFSPQNYYSEVTCISKTKGSHKRSKGLGGKYTETNPFAVGFLRPSVVELDDTEPADTPTATAAQIGRMFGNAATFEIELATWLTPGGQLWSPDQLVTLKAPYAMVYSETTLMIRAVQLRASAESKTAKIMCVLPGSFSGEFPDGLPWDG